VTIFSNFKPNKQFLLKNSENFQVFQAPTGSSTADKAFIAVLCDNIFKFQAK